MCTQKEKRKKSSLAKVFSLLRVHQWYKNLLIFIGLIFEKLYLDVGLLLRCIGGFFILCMVSSSNYIINDILDRKDDKVNQIKNNLVGSTITLNHALSIAIIMISGSFVVSYLLSSYFFIFVLLIAALGQTYNIFAKRIIIVDVLDLSIIYILRCLSGYYVVGKVPYLLLILPIVFIAIFLIFIKKRAIFSIIGKEKAIIFRENYKAYRQRVNNGIVNLFCFLISLAYFVYIITNQKFNQILLFATFPFAVYLLFVIASITKKEPEMGIYLWKIIKYKRVLVSSTIIVICYIFAIIIL